MLEYIRFQVVYIHGSETVGETGAIGKEFSGFLFQTGREGKDNSGMLEWKILEWFCTIHVFPKIMNSFCERILSEAYSSPA